MKTQREGTCYDKVKKAFELSYGTELKLNLKEFIEAISENEKLLSYFQMYMLLYEAAFSLIRELSEPVAHGAVLESRQLRNIVKRLEESVSWDLLREKLLNILSNPPDDFKKFMEVVPTSAEILRKACEDPIYMLQQLPMKSASDAFTLLTPAIIIGAFQLPDGNPLLRYVVNLDVFSECGRYAEPGDGSTTLRLIAERRESAKVFLLSAELWVLGTYAYYLALEAIKRASARATLTAVWEQEPNKKVILAGLALVIAIVIVLLTITRAHTQWRYWRPRKTLSSQKTTRPQRLLHNKNLPRPNIRRPGTRTQQAIRPAVKP